MELLSPLVMIGLLGLVGFQIALYFVLGNDAIQVTGTFNTSNQDIHWSKRAAAASCVLVATLALGWWMYDGDIAFGRLAKVPYTPITVWHLIPPIVLAILTLRGIPVSTTFIIISAFRPKLISEMLVDSAVGFASALLIGLGLWSLLHYALDENKKPSKRDLKVWRVLQWISTACLLYSWISHDMANIAVYLPRTLTLTQLVFVCLSGSCCIFIAFSKNGGKIQEIVVNKTNTKYVRSATVIDLVFAAILLVLKEWSDVPMSTTWVFVGLIIGREIAVVCHHPNKKVKHIYPIVLKDFVKVICGLFISIACAWFVNRGLSFWS